MMMTQAAAATTTTTTTMTRADHQNGQGTGTQYKERPPSRILLVERKKETEADSICHSFAAIARRDPPNSLSLSLVSISIQIPLHANTQRGCRWSSSPAALGRSDKTLAVRHDAISSVYTFAFRLLFLFLFFFFLSTNLMRFFFSNNPICWSPTSRPIQVLVQSGVYILCVYDARKDIDETSVGFSASTFTTTYTYWNKLLRC